MLTNCGWRLLLNLEKMSSMNILLLIPFALLFIGCGKDSPTTPGDPYIKISIDDIAKAEGTGGSTPFAFTITLDKVATNPVTVTYATEEGSAKADDFTMVTNQQVSFQAGETSKQVIISVVGDNVKEGDEQFTVRITATTQGIFAKGTGTGTIINDDDELVFGNAGYDAPTSYPGYSLVWADEFNGNTLNTTNWMNENGDGCPNLCGWGNNELEFYTSRPENIFFQEGKLVIAAKAETYNGKAYTSSKIISRGKQSFKYGRIDIRAKLPRGKGIWPALWMLPQSNVHGGWPTSGEIDIMEMIGHEPAKTHGTLHFGPGPGSTQITKSYNLASGTFYDQFHVFSLEWKENQLKWLVDGVVFQTVNKADLGNAVYPFNESFYFIINLAVGGNWPGNPDATTTFPQYLVVDYVRVYQ